MKVLNEIIKTILFSILTLSSVIILWNSDYLLTLVLFLIAVFWLYFNYEKNYILTFVICSILGAFAEVIAIQFGVWQYSNPSFLGIPIWLFPLWGLASLTMISINSTIKELLQ